MLQNDFQKCCISLNWMQSFSKNSCIDFALILEKLLLSETHQFIKSKNGGEGEQIVWQWKKWALVRKKIIYSYT